jgi:hypothetical protein
MTAIVRVNHGVVEFEVNDKDRDEDDQLWWGGEIVRSSSPRFDVGDYFQATGDEMMESGWYDWETDTYEEPPIPEEEIDYPGL